MRPAHGAPDDGQRSAPHHSRAGSTPRRARERAARCRRRRQACEYVHAVSPVWPRVWPMAD
eukprot:1011591-Prymnesium_polylepis.1